MNVLSRWVLLIAIIAAFAGGAVLLVRTSSSGGGIQIILPTPTGEAAIGLKVYISGSVRAPVVYEVEEGSRLADVIEAAGGATAEELKALPGIGDVKTQAIVSYRESNGGFPSVEDLTKVLGIGSVILESIREMVEVR